jgi:hypothetical protein
MRNDNPCFYNREKMIFLKLHLQLKLKQLKWLQYYKKAAM